MRCKNVSSRYYLQGIISMILNMVIFCGVFIIFGLTGDSKLLYGALGIVIALMPFVVFYLTQYLYYQKIELSDVQEVYINTKIENRKYARFKFSMKLGKKTVPVETRNFFPNNPYSSFGVDVYYQKKCLVGYNHKRKEAVVIKCIEE